MSCQTCRHFSYSRQFGFEDCDCIKGHDIQRVGSLVSIDFIPDGECPDYSYRMTEEDNFSLQEGGD